LLLCGTIGCYGIKRGQRREDEELFHNTPQRATAPRPRHKKILAAVFRWRDTAAEINRWLGY